MSDPRTPRNCIDRLNTTRVTAWRCVSNLFGRVDIITVCRNCGVWGPCTRITLSTCLERLMSMISRLYYLASEGASPTVAVVLKLDWWNGKSPRSSLGRQTSQPFLRRCWPVLPLGMRSGTKARIHRSCNM